MNSADVKKLETSEELHVFARLYNWDNEAYEALRWIVNNPICDKGTALMLYWYSEPRSLLNEYADEAEAEADGYYIDVYRFVKEIESLFLPGFYVRQNISFDPHNEDSDDLTLDDLDENAKQEIPEELLKASPGDFFDIDKYRI